LFNQSKTIHRNEKKIFEKKFIIILYFFLLARKNCENADKKEIFCILKEMIAFVFFEK